MVEIADVVIKGYHEMHIFGTSKRVIIYKIL